MSDRTTKTEEVKGDESEKQKRSKILSRQQKATANRSEIPTDEIPTDSDTLIKTKNSLNELKSVKN